VPHLHESAGHYATETTLHTFLAEQGIPMLTGVDTRALVRRIRAQGVMPTALAVAASRAALPPVAELQARAVAADYGAVDHVAAATCAVPTWHPPAYPDAPTVALMDYGAKSSILARLRAAGAGVWVLPAHTPAAQVRALEPDAVLLSNGPGDPARLDYAVQAIRELVAGGALPIMGICLGNQLLAQALGGRTFKMAYGHRGINQPVLDHATGRVIITTQNHGYAVDPASLPPSVQITHTNLNDGTVEGLAHRHLPVWGVQWHPEAHPGPADSDYLFDRLLARTLEVACAA
jgi:carbamoyl-phosphate synthase small subunit